MKKPLSYFPKWSTFGVLLSNFAALCQHFQKLWLSNLQVQGEAETCSYLVWISPRISIWYASNIRNKTVLRKNINQWPIEHFWMLPVSFTYNWVTFWLTLHLHKVRVFYYLGYKFTRWTNWKTINLIFCFYMINYLKKIPLWLKREMCFHIWLEQHQLKT